MNSETPKNADLPLDVNKMRWVYPIQTDNLNYVYFILPGMKGDLASLHQDYKVPQSAAPFVPLYYRTWRNAVVIEYSLSLTNYLRRRPRPCNSGSRGGSKGNRAAVFAGDSKIPAKKNSKWVTFFERVSQPSYRQEMLERYKEIWKDGLLSQPLDKVIGLEDKRKMFKDLGKK